MQLLLLAVYAVLSESGSALALPQLQTDNVGNNSSGSFASAEFENKIFLQNRSDSWDSEAFIPYDSHIDNVMLPNCHLVACVLNNPNKKQVKRVNNWDAFLHRILFGPEVKIEDRVDHATNVLTDPGT